MEGAKWNVRLLLLLLARRTDLGGKPDWMKPRP